MTENAMPELLALAKKLALWKAPLPAAAVQALDVWTALSEPQRGPRAANPLDDLRAAAASGRLAPEDARDRVTAAALELVTQQRAAAVVADLALPLASHAAGAIAEAGDEIVASLAVPFAAAAERLAVAAAVVPSGATADVAIALGSQGVDAWRALAEAGATLDALALIRVELIKVASYGSNAVSAPALVVAEIADRNQLVAADSILMNRDPRSRTEQGGRWRLLIDANLELRLNTAAEARDVERAANASTPVVAGRRG
jgi:hypothetical protein